jgi:4a-hydroxytetrahydrobiopterin dehydratase
MATLLSPADLSAGMSELPAWAVATDHTSISRAFDFANFNQAWGFMSRVALIAEKMGHHPDWSNVYRHVSVTLSTHDAGGITKLDLRLAAAMDRIAETLSPAAT